MTVTDFGRANWRFPYLDDDPPPPETLGSALHKELAKLKRWLKLGKNKPALPDLHADVPHWLRR